MLFGAVRSNKRLPKGHAARAAVALRSEGTIAAIARLHAQGKHSRMFKACLYSNSFRDLGLCAECVKIERFSWSDLRRTCAPWPQRDGVALELVSAVLDHADTRMVERVFGRLDD